MEIPRSKTHLGQRAGSFYCLPVLSVPAWIASEIREKGARCAKSSDEHGTQQGVPNSLREDKVAWCCSLSRAERLCKGEPRTAPGSVAKQPLFLVPGVTSGGNAVWYFKRLEMETVCVFFTVFLVDTPTAKSIHNCHASHLLSAFPGAEADDSGLPTCCDSTARHLGLQRLSPF